MTSISRLFFALNQTTGSGCTAKFINSTFYASSRMASTSYPPQRQQFSPKDQAILQEENERRDRIIRISDSMKLYLKTVQENAELMEEKKQEFEQGKRHLANIMGFNPETLTQKQIDASIEYLFPSGLSKLSARPTMVSPEIGYPPRELDLDENGWPNHHLFWTLRPKFYTLLSNINKRTHQLIKEYDRRQLAYHWGKMSAEEANQGHPMSTALLKEWKYTCKGELINDDMKAAIAVALEYMAQLPNASLEADFFANFGLDSKTQGEDNSQEDGFKKPMVYHARRWRCEIPKVVVKGKVKMATGISFVKASKVEAIVSTPGTGKLTVDGHHYDEFRDVQAREILLSPMVVCGLLGQVDIEARLLSGPGGKSVIPRAVRHASSLCLAALYPEWGQRLRLAGLLDPEMRKRERSKINQPGARAKWIWKKR